MSRLAPSHENIDPDLIAEEPGNPNQMEPDEYAALKATIKEHGLVQPLLVYNLRSNEDDGTRVMLIDGAHRLQVARDLNLETVPCVVADVTPDEARALRISMNKIRGQLDLAAVARELDLLSKDGWGATDLALTGYSAQEVESLLAAATGAEEDIEAEFPAPPEDEEPGQTADKPWVLDLTFASKAERDLCKKRLKKAAGKSKDLAKGLLALLEGSGS